MDNSPTHELIVILDFGAQYTQLIARRIRECNVYCEILPCSIDIARLRTLQPIGIILSGGPSSVYDSGAPTVDPQVFELGVPVLGICYGQQLMAKLLGGNVVPAEKREYGAAELTVTAAGDLFDGANGTLGCWMSHGDTVLSPPAGFEILATTPSTPVASMQNPGRKLYGVQFHPEVAHTPFGKELLRKFLVNVCGCHQSWTPTNFVQEQVESIRKIVGSQGVVCGVSGGIDSCCVAALVHKAVGDQLTCIFVDHGLLRKGEAEQVRTDFADALGIRLIYVDAEKRFLRRLADVTDPETKRKIIGEEFVRVFEEHADNIEGASFLAQGTLYPDVIESGAGTAATIKTHHNVGGLPVDMRLKVLEPLRYLFKDEARAVAAELGLPDAIVYRHPFPGPGLAIRIMGDITKDRLDTLRDADAIFIDEIRNAGLYSQIWQAFAALLPSVKSVGVMGDSRTYACPIVLRAVASEDAMTAKWFHMPYDVLEKISSRIVNEVQGINRVVYDISSKPPATIEWE
ncbi:MAG: glutamine-hydrolyzing GMP synthase [Chthonomonadales bacterium]